jgi:hypothetical protein
MSEKNDVGETWFIGSFPNELSTASVRLFLAHRWDLEVAKVCV